MNVRHGTKEKIHQPIIKTWAGHNSIPTKDVFPLNFFCNDLYLETAKCTKVTSEGKA